MTNNPPLTSEEMYLHFYQRSLEINTRHEVDFIEQVCPLRPGDTVVDIPCGYGRHALELARRHPNASIQGFDISPLFISMANQATRKNAKFSIADMRAAPLPQNIALVTCLYTSFGYFGDEGNRAFLQRMFSALKPGGKLIIDVINTARICPGKSIFMRQGDDFIADDVHIGAEGEYRFQRRYVIGQQTYLREYTLRTYTPEAFIELFENLGGECRFYGGFDGKEYQPHNERMIMVASRREGIG